MKLTARRIGGVTPFRPKENTAGRGKFLGQDTLSLAKAVLLRHGEGGAYPFPPASMILLLLEQKEKLDHAWKAVQLLTVLNRTEVYQITSPMYQQIFSQLNTQIQYELTRAYGLMGKEVRKLEQVFENLRSENRQRQDKVLRTIRESLLERSRLYEKNAFFQNRGIKISAAPLPDYKEIWRQSVAFCQPARDLAAYLEGLKPENQKEIAGLLGSTREELFQKLYQMKPSGWAGFTRHFKSRITYINRLWESRELFLTEQLEEAADSLTDQPGARALNETDPFHGFLQLSDGVREDSRGEEGALESFIEYVSYADSQEWDRLVETIYQHSSEDWLSRQFVSMAETASFQEYESLSQEERLKEKNRLLLLLREGDPAGLAAFLKKMEQSQPAVFPKEAGQPIRSMPFSESLRKGPLADFVKKLQGGLEEDDPKGGEALQAFLEYVSYADIAEWDSLVQSMYQHSSEDWLSRQFVSMAETVSFREYEKLSQMERLQEKRALMILLQEIRKSQSPVSMETLNQAGLAGSPENLEQAQEPGSPKNLEQAQKPGSLENLEQAQESGSLENLEQVEKPAFRDESVQAFMRLSLEKRVDELQLHWRLARQISKMDTKTRLFLGKELPVLYEGKREEIFRFLEENTLSEKTLNRMRLITEVAHMELSQWDSFIKAVYENQREDGEIREFVSLLERSSFEEYQKEPPERRMERKEEFFTFLQQMEESGYEEKQPFFETDFIWKDFVELVFYSMKSSESFSEGFLETLSEPYSPRAFMELISAMDISRWDRLVKAMYERSSSSWLSRQFTAMSEAESFLQYETLTREERLYEKNALLLLLKESGRTGGQIPVDKRIEEMEIRWHLARQINKLADGGRAVLKQLLPSMAFTTAFGKQFLEAVEKEEIFWILTEEKQPVRELKRLEALVHIAEAEPLADIESVPFAEARNIQLRLLGVQKEIQDMQPGFQDIQAENRNMQPGLLDMQAELEDIQEEFLNMQPVFRDARQETLKGPYTRDRELPENVFDYQPAHMVITPSLPPNPKFSPSVPRVPDVARMIEEEKKENEGDEADIAVAVRKNGYPTATGEYQKQMEELTNRLEEQQKQLEELKSGQVMLVKKTSTEELTAQVLKQLQSQLRLEKMRRGF